MEYLQCLKQEVCDMLRKCKCIPLGVVVASAALLLLCHAQQSKSADALPTDQVTKMADAYVQAINRGDAAAAAAYWTDDGEFGDSSTGRRVKGHKAILAALQEAVSPERGVQVETTFSKVEIVAPGVATEEGRLRVTPKAGPIEISRFVALYVKRGDQWKIRRVWETDLPLDSHYEQLAGLAWMIGEWTDTRDGKKVKHVCRWSKNRNFITRTFKVSDAGGEVNTGTEVIGWDPADEEIRSWTFDSKGGFIEQVWSQENGKWKPTQIEDIEPADLATQQAGLKPLAWLLGQWEDRGEEDALEATVKWTDNKAFLVQRFKASVRGVLEQEGVRVFGWDPEEKRIRSWLFDTDGGFAEANWSSRPGRRWCVNSRHVLPDGRLASSITTFKRIDANTFTWRRVAPELDGEILPSTPEMTVVRKPAHADSRKAR
jgi:ketosteroid isomerase-like protein